MSRKALDLGTALLEKGFEKPLFLMAHHDDEISQAGVFQRVGPNVRAVWVTNSDGLYFESEMSPEEYGRVRMAEGVNSVARAGIPESSTRCYGYSEVEIYRYLSELHSGRMKVQDAAGLFDRVRDSVVEAVFETNPDAVFTLAWQGGQPEHDLVHFFTALAVKKYRQETGRQVSFFHMPAYEYTILVAHRFHPLYKGQRMRIRLTDTEMNIKMAMIEQYPSQRRLFSDFEKVFRLVGKAGYLTGGPKNAEEWLATEEFGPVPEWLDYTRNTHLFDKCTYINDDFEGVPVTFSKSVLPLVRRYLSESG